MRSGLLDPTPAGERGQTKGKKPSAAVNLDTNVKGRKNRQKVATQLFWNQ